jgi:type I restriction-modification system DNA methylase subunit
LTPPLEGEGLNNEITPFKGSKSKTLGVYQGGFDIIVGNPPYGAKLSQQEQEYLLKKYNFGTTETAILFILKSLDLLSDGGYIGFIIPKSFCFASNYQKIRELVWDNVVQIVDCGKVWDEVKLEQIIVIIQKGVKHDFYINKTRNGEKFENEIKIEKNIAK